MLSDECRKGITLGIAASVGHLIREGYDDGAIESLLELIGGVDAAIGLTELDDYDRSQLIRFKSSN